MTNPPPSTVRLEVRLFGSLEVSAAGDAALRISRKKVAQLLVYLLLHRTVPVPKNQLAGTLWPESTDATARSSLLRRLNDLLHSLPPAAEGRPWFEFNLTTVWWNPAADVTLDVEEFEVLCRRARVASWERPAAATAADLERAVQLYRGELMPAIRDEWIVPYRQRLASLLGQALDQLLTLQLAEENHGPARLTAEHWVAHDPLRESPRQSLMWLLAIGGERDAALAQFDAYRSLLRERLGIEPSQATVRLAEAIDAGQPLEALPEVLSSGGERTFGGERGKGGERSAGSATAQPQGGQPGKAPGQMLPAPPSSFVGREQQIEEVMHHLSLARMLTLTGVGGSGKTRLALEVAGRVRERYADGVAWVELEAIGHRELVANEIARVLGVRTAGARPVLELIADHLEERTMLLIFDNCEHLGEGLASVIETLLARAPGIHVLATSRAKVGLAGEDSWVVPPLTLPPEGEFPTELELTTSEAVRLFVARVRQVWPEFATDLARLRAIGQVCRQLEGIPLAIELAAARISVLEVADIAARLTASFDLLRSQDHTHPERHQTLSTAIEWSHRLLSVPEQVLLDRLSVFSDGFTVGAAAAVAQGDGNAFGAQDALAGEDVFDLVGRLVDKSFVTLDARHGRARRFRLLEMIRQFAGHRLVAAGEAELVAGRHAGFYVQLAEQVGPRVIGPNPEKWLDQLEAEQHNIHKAMNWIRGKGDVGLAARLGAGMWRYWHNHDQVMMPLQWMKSFGDRLGEMDVSAGKAEFCRGVGSLSYLVGDMVSAQSFFESSLDSYQQAQDTGGMQTLFHSLGLVELVLGNFEPAREYHQQALLLARRVSSPSKIVSSLLGLAEIAFLRGENVECRRLLDEIVNLMRTDNVNDLQSSEYFRISAVLSESCADFDDALMKCGDMERIGDSLQSSVIISNAKSIRGRILSKMALYDEAEIQLRLAMSDGQRRQMDSAIALNLHNLGELEVLRGNYEVARLYLNRSLTMKNSLGAKWDRVPTLILLAETELEDGDYVTATILAEEALKEAYRFQAKSLIAQATLVLGRSKREQRLRHHANSLLIDSLRLHDELGDKRSIAVVVDVVAYYAALENFNWIALRLTEYTDDLRRVLHSPRTRAEQNRYSQIRSGLSRAMENDFPINQQTLILKSIMTEATSMAVDWLANADLEFNVLS